MNAQGTVHKYGDNVDTDVIIPARYLNTSNHEELAAHCMEDIDKDFVDTRQNRATSWWRSKNFGCGSSREHAPIAIKASGISCVIASTFARIFYRNAINIGLAILECDGGGGGYPGRRRGQGGFRHRRHRPISPPAKPIRPSPSRPLFRILSKRAAFSTPSRTGCKNEKTLKKARSASTDGFRAFLKRNENKCLKFRFK